MEKNRITEEDIDDEIYWIMRNFGPDGHVDGKDKIVKFIMCLLKNDIESWNKYKARLEE